MDFFSVLFVYINIWIKVCLLFMVSEMFGMIVILIFWFDVIDLKYYFLK